MFNYYLHYNIVHREKLIAKCIHLTGKVISARTKAEAFPIKAAVSKVQNVIANAKKLFNFSSPANTPWIGYVNTICPNTGQTDLFNNYIDSNTATMTCSVILLQGSLKANKNLCLAMEERVMSHFLSIYSLHFRFTHWLRVWKMDSKKAETRRGAELYLQSW